MTIEKQATTDEAEKTGLYKEGNLAALSIASSRKSKTSQISRQADKYNNLRHSSKQWMQPSNNIRKIRHKAKKRVQKIRRYENSENTAGK